MALFGPHAMSGKRIKADVRTGRSKHSVKIKNRKHPAMERVMERGG
jgi:hypothetical protein